MECWNQCCG